MRQGALEVLRAARGTVEAVAPARGVSRAVVTCGPYPAEFRAPTPAWLRRWNVHVPEHDLTTA
ncbi:hypothetical protein [Kineococcus auxinigenes]|uniref:hypothetical protein n=1 Tax=unclassified Kineococcus TaxID=2621656 RepID=UPI003D7C60C9